MKPSPLVLLAIVLAGCGGDPPTDEPQVKRPVKKKRHLPALVTAYSDPVNVDKFWVRPGFRCELVAQLQEARCICVDPKDRTLYVAQPGHATIAILRPKNGKYEKVADFVKNVLNVHGLMWKDGWVWYTRPGSIYKARCTNGSGVANQIVPIIPETGKVIKGHNARSILADESGFYSGIGDPLNASDETKSDREKLWRYSLDGKRRTPFVSGVRNVEKLLFRPGTKEVWGMDHGSDAYGQIYGEKPPGKQPITDEAPKEKFYHFEAGGFYGHPFFVEGRFPRPEFAKRPDIVQLAAKVNMPAMLYGPHWAPDGWCFYTGDQIPGAKGDAFMAFHGSWNRTHKAGYRIERTLFDRVTGKPYGHYMIVHTLGAGEKVLARPVDVAQAPDGSLLWSDDFGHRIYRISYVGRQAGR